MNAYDLIRASQNGQAVPNIARQFGLNERQTETAVRLMSRDLARALEANMLTRDGLAGLIQAMSSGHHVRYAEDASVLADPAVRNDGNAILGHLFGSKEVSRGVALKSSRASGIDEASLQQVLPYLASMLMGSLSKQGRQPLRAFIEGMPKLPHTGTGKGPVIPGGNRYGDDPVAGPRYGSDEPGQRPRYGNDEVEGPETTPSNAPSDPWGDLTDILNKRSGGGSSTGGGAGGGLEGGLGGMIRDVLGQLLGFGDRGMIGNLVRLFLLRYGWRIAQWVIGRMFGMR